MLPARFVGSWSRWPPVQPARRIHFPYASNTLYRALEETWGIKPAYKREGGSVPIVGEMQRILGFDSVLTGFGLPDDNVHSPNERLHLETFYKGVDALIRFFNYLGEDN